MCCHVKFFIMFFSISSKKKLDDFGKITLFQFSCSNKVVFMFMPFNLYTKKTNKSADVFNSGTPPQRSKQNFHRQKH